VCRSNEIEQCDELGNLKKPLVSHNQGGKSLEYDKTFHVSREHRRARNELATEHGDPRVRNNRKYHVSDHIHRIGNGVLNLVHRRSVWSLNSISGLA
jgi:hypothetical protein